MITANDLENITILYAEDDFQIQEGTVQTLNLFGIKVISANNGLEGLELFNNSKQNIDMILTVIKMPKLDGLSMIREIRKTDKFIPVVITTAHQETDFLKTSIDLNVSAYVLKPIDIYQLRDSLIKAIEPKILKDRLIEKHQLMLTQSRFATMGEMINMIAHQWRQPLAAIGTASFNLKYKLQTHKFDLNTKEGQKEQASFFEKKLDEIEYYVQNLTATVDDFRNFFKSDKKIVKKTINEPIENSLKIMQKSLDSNNITVITQLQSTNIINIYENEIMHVILNILNNAQDNFLENSKESMMININTKDLQDTTQIDIFDNGGGINDTIIDKIFKPYFSTKKEKNGTGIGLYMSKTIIEQNHQGKLNVYNEKDGVTFTITLPTI
ncbi:hybrid sensor histidine kinase/response regulator [Poseidonibacter ostreae]|nr:hybrid sensor histidine kinase/response regulator [Poseidonibacter ostreae]